MTQTGRVRSPSEKGLLLKSSLPVEVILCGLSHNGAQSVFGGPIPAVVVAICLTLFAISTVLTWGLYGSRCFEFLFGHKAVKVYQIIFALVVIVGAMPRDLPRRQRRGL